MRLSSCLRGLVLLFLLGGAARAEVKLPAIFGSHMVLQRGIKVPVWGWAAPGEAVTVTVGQQVLKATADAAGKWRVDLAPLAPGDAALTVTVTGTNTITLDDVWVGDVWVCSGQSNMEFGLQSVNHADDVLAKADEPKLRLFVVQKLTSAVAETDCKGQWAACTSASVRGFSAVGYYFARNLLPVVKVPIGLIGTYWGGTPAQSWTPPTSFQGAPELADYAARQAVLGTEGRRLLEVYNKETVPQWQAAHDAWDKARKQDPAEAEKAYKAALDRAQLEGTPEPTPPAAGPGPEPKKPLPPFAGGISPNEPSSLYLGMVAPIVPYAIKGAIWYQGESNAGNAKQYRTLFPTMIKGWRQQWGQGDFPFLFVQLANFMGRLPDPADTDWARLREAQTMTLSLPATGMAVIIDVGAAKDIHPRDKDDVGQRLALAARHVAYGEDLVYSGPRFAKLTIADANARVTFTEIGGGLVIGQPPPAFEVGTEQLAPTDHLDGFAIAGEDQKWVWATASIEGDTVVLSNPAVPHPVAVRYGWANNPSVNLYNKEGLPASPFRTDDWPVPPPPPPKATPAPAPAPAGR